MKLLINYTKFVFIAIVFAAAFFAASAKPTYAAIPDIEGYVLVSGTNTPVVGVWVKLTNSNSTDSSCVSGAVDQSRYARTDSSGKYTFVSWTNGGSSAVGEGVNIDTNFDGSKDAIQYPTFDSCDPSGTPGSVFSCGRDPFRLEVIKPRGWTGNFDTFGTTVESPCEFCINNGTFTYQVPVDLFYHPRGGGTNTPTPTTSSGTSTPTPTPGSGSISLNTVPPLSVGGSSVPVGVSSTANVTSATFTIGNVTVASTCPTSSCPNGQSTFTDTPGFNAYVHGSTPGNTTLTVTCTVSGGGPCTGDSVPVSVANPVGWWQTKNSDVVTNGNILSQIPTSCIAPSCINSLITAGTNQNAGIAIAHGTINVSPGNVSSPSSWNASSQYTGSQYTYDFFENKATCGTIKDFATPITKIDDITSLGASSNGYYWVRYTGSTPLSITGDLAVGSNKVVLFVKNQDLLINKNITANLGTGFFIAIVGSSPSGSNHNIIVNPAVTELDGLYFVDGKFKTGTNGPGLDPQLLVHGSVVSMESIVLERNLSNNATSPAEIFEYSPSQMMQFPSCLGESNIQWKELAP